MDRIVLGASVVFVMATNLFGQAATGSPSPALLALSKTEHVLRIIDPATLKVVRQRPSGEDPHEVAASADGRRAYISNYGGGAYHTITSVDLVGQAPSQVIELGALRGPHGLEFAVGKVWFTAEAAKAIGSIDPTTNQIDWVMGTGQNRTHMLAVSADAKRILTTNVNSGTVSILEQTTGPRRLPAPDRTGGPPLPDRGGSPAGGRGNAGPAPPAEWEQTVVPVGRGAEGLDISPDGKEAWVANAQDGTISVIDVIGKRVTQTLSADVRGANRLKFTPDGSLVLVSTLSGPDVTVLRAATHAVVKRIAVGHGAAGILIQPDGARAYIACTPDEYVAVLDLKSLSVVGHIAAGKQPDGLAWAVRR